jgi:hypothetical protein
VVSLTPRKASQDHSYSAGQAKMTLVFSVRRILDDVGLKRPFPVETIEMPELEFASHVDNQVG